MDYEKLLEYYLTSGEWEMQKLIFFECYCHYYDPYEGTDRSGTVYLRSEVYMEYLRKDAVLGGGPPFLALTEAEFQKYFDKRYSEDQRFAVLFALWWGLPAEQVAQIADLRQRKHSWELLDRFLRSGYGNKYYAEIFAQRLWIQPDPEPRIVPVKEILPDGSICYDEGGN